MNKKGTDYINKTDLDFASLRRKMRELYAKPTSEQVYERCMRLGIENKLFELKDTTEIENIAEKTLKEDFYNKYKFTNDMSDNEFDIWFKENYESNN